MKNEFVDRKKEKVEKVLPFDMVSHMFFCMRRLSHNWLVEDVEKSLVKVDSPRYALASTLVFTFCFSSVYAALFFVILVFEANSVHEAHALNLKNSR